MFASELLQRASEVLSAAAGAGVRIVTAETCTGGLVGACLTAVSGASQVYERGFVLYHASAKATGLGVPEAVARAHGAVSAEVTRGLAEGALAHSGAGVSVAVTGYAGPGGGTTEDPVGTVYVAAAGAGRETRVARRRFSGARDEVRLAAVGAALESLYQQLAQGGERLP